MRDLFLSECRRFKSAALTFALVHLVLQLVVNRLFDLLQLRYQAHMIALALYLIAALAFAMVQFGAYRQPGRWLWLLHRPMERLAIFGAIGSASASLIVFAVGLPALLTVAVTDLFSSRVVDLRHYLLVLELVLLTMTAWLAGTYVILTGRSSAIVILLLPLLLMAHLASGFVMLLPAALCLGLMVCIAFTAFKPDRTAPPAGAALVATALPLQLGFYFALIWAGSLLFQNVQMLSGVHPLSRPVPPTGGFTESTRSEGQALFLRGLASSRDPAAPQWQRQVALSETANFEQSTTQYPVRHSFSNLDTATFTDAQRHTEWTFSHDAMLFKGRDIYTLEARGVMGRQGAGDATPIGAVPLLADAGYLMLPQELLLRDAATNIITSLITLRAPETLAREPVAVGEMLYVITNLRLVAYASPIADASRAPLKERFSVALPEAFSSLDRIDIAPLLDGALVSLSFGRDMIDGAGEASQVIVFVDAAGKAREVARRAIAHDFPILFEHYDWWLSPVLHQVLALPEALLDKGRILDRGKARYTNPLERKRPAEAWIGALLAALLSALAGWYWLRGVALERWQKTAWLASCLLLGAPALACLMALQPRARKNVKIFPTKPAVLAAI
jgi:hypothetical protein